MPANKQNIVHLILSSNKNQNTRSSSLNLLHDLESIVNKIEDYLSRNVLLTELPWTKADPLLFLLYHENGERRVVELRKTLVQERSKKETSEIIKKLKAIIDELDNLHKEGYRIEALTALKWGSAIFVLAEKRTRL